MRGARAVHIEADFGLRDDLMHVDIGRARNARDTIGEPLGDFVVRLRVAADDLQVDGRRQSEIDDLARDIRGLEEEVHVGELLVEALAKTCLVFGGRAVLFLVQRDENLAIGGRDRRNVALRDRGPTVRDADVVDQHLEFTRRNDGADFALDSGEAGFGFLEARAGGGARVEAHLAGIDVREEVLPDEFEQTHR